MSGYQPTNDMPVDRREETVVTQQPGYATTEHVMRDVTPGGPGNVHTTHTTSCP
jgi:hypothetical protein